MSSISGTVKRLVREKGFGFLLGNDGKAVKGADKKLAKAKVVGEIVRHGKGDKIVVFKMKRRKNYAKKQGHRQGFTEVRIRDITLG